MGTDLFQSRRNYNEYCRWWSRNESDEDEHGDDALIMKRVPTGSFMAKEVSPEQLKAQTIAGSFVYDENVVTIKTPDNISGIKAKDLVEFRGEKWFVDNVQKSKAKMQNTHYASDRNCSHFWYLDLRK